MNSNETIRLIKVAIVLGGFLGAGPGYASFKPKTVERLSQNVKQVINARLRTLKEQAKKIESGQGEKKIATGDQQAGNGNQKTAGLKQTIEHLTRMMENLNVNNIERDTETGAMALWKANLKSNGDELQAYFSLSPNFENLPLLVKVVNGNGEEIYAYPKMYPTGASPELRKEVERTLGNVQLNPDMARSIAGPGEHVLKAARVGVGNYPRWSDFFRVIVNYDIDTHAFHVSKILKGLEDTVRTEIPLVEPYFSFSQNDR